MSSEIKVDTISENTSANGVVIDSVTLKDGAVTATAASTITTADNTDTLTLTSTDADASSGPNLRFYRNSSSPADNDVIVQVDFEGRNDNSQDVIYGQFLMSAQDVSDGTEDSVVTFGTMKAGSLTEQIGFNASEVVFNNTSADIDFRVESNGNANMLHIDGGNDNVNIGASARQTNWSNGTTIKPILHAQGLNDDNRSVAFSYHSNDNSGPFLCLGKSKGTAVGAYNLVSDDGQIGVISFQGADGTHMLEGASIRADVDGTPGANDMPGRLEFHTTADGADSGSERMRISSAGKLEFSMSTFGSSVSASVTGFEIHKNGNSPFIQHGTTGTGTATMYNFINGNGVVGKISVSGSATTYATSSDYRLKENVVTDWDATTRLKQLKPSRFNFKVDAGTTVDGFLAHEVSGIVPEAITGNKDETETKTKVVVHANGHVLAEGVEEANWTAGKVADEEGNTKYPSDSTWEASKVVPIYQAIDQSKLVPLLVKTVQELEARIKTLEDA